MYLCPKGFNGTYKLLVRRVWGQVITGKVSVELIAHYGTPEVKRNQPPDSPGQGRRPPSPSCWRRPPQRENQRPASRRGQRRHRPDRHEPPSARPADGCPGRSQCHRGLERRQPGRRHQRRRRRGGDPLVLPFAVQGAVGYQPIIITLPEGANLAATGGRSRPIAATSASVACPCSPRSRRSPPSTTAPASPRRRAIRTASAAPRTAACKRPAGNSSPLPRPTFGRCPERGWG